MEDGHSRPHSHVARPTVYDGASAQFMSFMRSVNLYIAGNSKDPLLAEDKDKIIFTLSYMKLGHADIWADNFLEEAEESGNWGTWTDFKVSLKKSFSFLTPTSPCMRLRSWRP